MILVDTSAWVEYLRATGSPMHHHVRRLIEANASLATTDVIVMEVLAGAWDENHAQRLRRILLGYEVEPVRGLTDYELAAELYRACRRAGETVRRLTDCLIGAVALRAGLPILHRDADFDVLARHAGVPVTALPTA